MKKSQFNKIKMIKCKKKISKKEIKYQNNIINYKKLFYN